MDTLIKIDYLKGIAENDFSVLEKIYEESLPEVIKYVKRNSGNLDDAKDVFQEGILVIYKKVSQSSLELTTSFHIFLFSVCKRIWLKKLKRKSHKKEVALDEFWEDSFEENFEEKFITSRKWALYHKKFQSLAEECRKVLQMLFNGRSGKEIASTMNYSEDYAKRKKYKCKLHLTKLIRNDAEYKHLTEV